MSFLVEAGRDGRDIAKRVQLNGASPVPDPGSPDGFVPTQRFEAPLGGRDLTDAVQDLAAEPGVVFSEPQPLGTTSWNRGPVNDPLAHDSFEDGNWWLDAVDAERAWDLSRGHGIDISIIDSGVDGDHDDLDGDYDGGVSMVGGANEGDVCGHGTHVAGLAGAQTNNGLGVAAAGYGADTRSHRVFPGDGAGNCGGGSNIDDAINRASANGAEVLNLSLSGDPGVACPSDVQAAVDDAVARGTFLVAAAGNHGQVTSTFPGNCNGVFAVAASTEAGQLAGFSNRGAFVDLTAPGDNVVSTTAPGNVCGGTQNGYGDCAGTSMAAPLVSGSAALMYAHGATRNQIDTYLRSGAASFNCPSTGQCGAGLLDMHHTLHDFLSGNGWHGFINQRVTMRSGATVSSWGPGRYDVFARGSSDQLLHRWYANGSWHPSGSWENLGKPDGLLGSGIQGTPTAVSWGSGRIDVFARGFNNRLYRKYYNGSWSSWEHLGSPLFNRLVLTSSPTVASWGSGRLDVFVRANLGKVYQLTYRQNAGGWSNWKDRNWTIAGAPSAVSWGSGRIDVFARNSNDDLVQLSRKPGGGGSWHVTNLGGNISFAPSAASWGEGRIDVFVARGSDQSLLRIFYESGQGWNGFHNLGGTLTNAPGAVSDDTDRIDVFVRATDGTLRQRYCRDCS